MMVYSNNLYELLFGSLIVQVNLKPFDVTFFDAIITRVVVRPFCTLGSLKLFE